MREKIFRISPRGKILLFNRGKKFWQRYFLGNGAFPNFLIIGSIKCGTTSLYEYLCQHESIASSYSKEPCFFYGNFNGKFKKGTRWYRSHFFSKKYLQKNKKITGEASPNYIYYQEAAKNIKKSIPDGKFILLLRNPVDQLYSHYKMRMNNGSENRKFEESIRVLLDKGLDSSTDWIGQSNFIPQLKKWFSVFPNRDQTLIIKSERMFENPQEVFNEVCDFLEIPRQEIDFTPKNVGGYKDKMNPETRERLEKIFKEHNRELKEMLGEGFTW